MAPQRTTRGSTPADPGFRVAPGVRVAYEDGEGRSMSAGAGDEAVLAAHLSAEQIDALHAEGHLMDVEAAAALSAVESEVPSPALVVPDPTPESPEPDARSSDARPSKGRGR